MSEKMIQRHTRSAIFIHWFNTVSWIFLLATGLGLITNPRLSPVGTWWPQMLQSVFGGGGNLLYVHAVWGVIWALVFILYALINPRQNLVGFFREIFSISPARDVTWLFKKGLAMTLGQSFMVKKGIDPTLPEQGFYNVGQKLFAIPATLGGIVIAVTGVLMILSRFTAVNVVLVQWSMLLHFLAVGLVFAGLLIHIAMAALVNEERPAFRSMFTGLVPEWFAKHHNALWYQTRQSPELKN